MTTWVPTCAPNLWGHLSWECPRCSRAMHAIYPWNVTLTGRISSSGSFLVLRLNASSTPHAWTPRDLGFSLTGNWCVVWDPPLVAQLLCLTHRGPRTRQHILMTNAWPLLDPPGALSVRHPGRTACGTQLMWPTPEQSSIPWACRLQGIGPCHSWDPAYVTPRLLAVNDVRGLVGTQAPQSRAVNLFSKET